MIYPVVIYGDPILKKVAEPIDANYAELPKLIDDMFETMYNAHGVGLAAPQIGKSIRIFVVDGSGMDEENLADFKKVFINPQIIEESEDDWKFEEGCLSIPGIREKVERPENIRIQYMDENFQPHDEVFNGVRARIIQHEYDHLEGVMFPELLSTFKKSLLKGKLTAISKGEFDASYPVKLYQTGKRKK